MLDNQVDNGSMFYPIKHACECLIPVGSDNYIP